MDTLIEGLEMPKYRTLLEINPDGTVAEISPINNSRISTEATAIPVPEHGDLIDRDAVLNELKKHYKVGELAEVGEVACFIEEAEVVLERTT